MDEVKNEKPHKTPDLQEVTPKTAMGSTTAKTAGKIPWEYIKGLLAFNGEDFFLVLPLMVLYM